ncbi:MAG: type II toxin-antitoxin system PemK/MazF family toxin [Okeania sp. SIO3B5]|uniref:type II toxin-antitoxin system PemK/MazF family toxin n=1 Tax=Okeania sp. SIO3B5 TaxID=2607811 RepID=UPI001400FCED|nr:type II toxin-antitoxin system PemK/MazF family toxin [Okeania sp. SIO3B5]NEO53773.1 type II toxin-antitoxin system PemK/MazF family toxin [Okeania sp. SIO3B5]
MTIYKFGDVILVPFPFTNQTTSKKRPAVVVSSGIYQSQYADLIIMAITSQNKLISGVGEVIVTEWSNAGLVKPSVIKPVIATIEKGLIIRKLGKLENGDRQGLKNALSEILGE